MGSIKYIGTIYLFLPYYLDSMWLQKSFTLCMWLPLYLYWTIRIQTISIFSSFTILSPGEALAMYLEYPCVFLIRFSRMWGPDCFLHQAFLRVEFVGRNLERWDNVSPRQRAGLLPFTIKAVDSQVECSSVTQAIARSRILIGHLCYQWGTKGTSGNVMLWLLCQE